MCSSSSLQPASPPSTAYRDTAPYEWRAPRRNLSLSPLTECEKKKELCIAVSRWLEWRDCIRGPRSRRKWKCFRIIPWCMVMVISLCIFASFNFILNERNKNSNCKEEKRSMGGRGTAMVHLNKCNRNANGWGSSSACACGTNYETEICIFSGFAAFLCHSECKTIRWTSVCGTERRAKR